MIRQEIEVHDDYSIKSYREYSHGELVEEKNYNTHGELIGNFLIQDSFYDGYQYGFINENAIGWVIDCYKGRKFRTNIIINKTKYVIMQKRYTCEMDYVLIPRVIPTYITKTPIFYPTNEKLPNYSIEYIR